MSMRRWRGQRGDVPIVGGEHLLTAQNVSFDVQGQLSRRPGLTYLNGSGGDSLASFTAQLSGTWVIAIARTIINVEAV